MSGTAEQMASSYAIGAAAGLISALLFALGVAGIMLAAPLVYLAPLPLFIVGFGWGTLAAVIAGAAGALVLVLGFGPVIGAGYLITLVVPACLLIYLALLAREDPAQTASGSGAQQNVEWYPAGRLVAWSAVMAGALTALSIPILGLDAETYFTTLQEVLDKTLLQDIESRAGDQLDANQIAALKTFLARAFPAVSAMIWFLSIVLNMWAACRIMNWLGQCQRPAPVIEAMAYPQELSMVFVGSLILSMFGGLFGIIATGFAGACVVAYVLLGLAVIHAISRGTQLRPILLSAVYVSLVLIGWVGLIVASIGIGEPIFKLRDRFAKNSGNSGTSGT
jgi:hypothetical protein